MTEGRARPPKFPLVLERVSPAAQVQPARPALARGLGLDSESVRRRMVERLRAAGHRDEAVLAAMQAVPRHLFVDAALATQAYEDTSLPIGWGQTISKPSVVARMLELLRGGANARACGSLGRALEIGTGCGYQAALLALLGKHLMSIERIKPLHEKARANLANLREHRIRLVYGDGRCGHAPNAPYDTIVAAAGGDDLPGAWLEQLAVGGRLVAPLAAAGNAKAGHQVLAVVDREEERYLHSIHEAVLFVPLKSGLG